MTRTPCNMAKPSLTLVVTSSASISSSYQARRAFQPQAAQNCSPFRMAILPRCDRLSLRARLSRPTAVGDDAETSTHSRLEGYLW